MASVKGSGRLSRSKLKQDDSIMGTNNSSIVSKRSVERLYYSEPHLFRYFIRKPQRRSPLINRGYWLRMHAIEAVVKRFLDTPTEKQKLIVNLGCGYDPLPFQWLLREPVACKGTTFIDVDYPQLISKKCQVISETPQLIQLVGSSQEVKSVTGIYYQSPQYVALGCDLTDIHYLDDFLTKELSLASCMVLCTAEVSVTYMDPKAADALITWAAQYNDVQFCLLEQYLPNGPNHAFAKQMIAHFNNLHTPLRSVLLYPGLVDQERRFKALGWHSARARSLWDLWNDPSFLSAEQRLAINDREPFDEWEDFALFASHYFLLQASNGSEFSNILVGSNRCNSNSVADHQNRDYTPNSESLNIGVVQQSNSSIRRRLGAAFEISSGVIGHHGGLGAQGRLNTSDVYEMDNAAYDVRGLADAMICSRMCHTITNLANRVSLLVGGRVSPDHALSDCWLRRNETWQRVEDLPVPLYRHSATVVEMDSEEKAVLIFGGKTDSKDASNRWFLWYDTMGWIRVSVNGVALVPRFGAMISAISPNAGVLFGGMAADGTILQDFYSWIIVQHGAIWSVDLKCCSSISFSPEIHARSLYRFGATLTLSPMGLLLIGGVSSDSIQGTCNCICFSNPLALLEDSSQSIVRSFEVSFDNCGQSPLFIGHSVCGSKGSLAVVGGGSNCFSFGTYWNQSVWTLHRDHKQEYWMLNEQLLERTKQSVPAVQHSGSRDQLKAINSREASEIRDIVCLRVNNKRDFERIMHNSKPVKIGHLDLGPCLKNWSFDSLRAKVGSDRPVVVHEASEQHMNFLAKNFVYVTKPFGRFLDEIAQGSQQYLRSLSSEQPSERPAQLPVDFPELTADFQLPPELEFVSHNIHSSPLRISGPVTMWLHYDVMANVLCQIQGSKKVVLYPPSDIMQLKIAPGDSSSSINIFETGHDSHGPIAHTHPLETILRPGEVLFIPPLWLHATSPLETTSISVNVFFRNLRTGYAAGRDVYGNRDLQAYEKGRKDVAKVVQSFDNLPAPVSRFYLERLADELREKALAIAP